MKKQLFLVSLLILLPYVHNAQNVLIPDANFKTELVNNASINSNGDTEIQLTEAQAFTGTINVGNKSISDLTGIEAFTALSSLNCYNNSLTSLDVSANTALRNLQCYNNQLTSLDVSNNTALLWLWCNRNQLTSLDVTNNTTLTRLYCNNNQIPSLDVTNNTALTHLQCSDNLLTSLNVTLNTALTSFHCTNNQLSTLDVTNNIALTDLGCRGNQLPSLDVTNNTALIGLDCSNNLLTTLNVSNNTALTNLSCSNNQLSILDVSNNTALQSLFCSDNQLSVLDVSLLTVLVNFWCGNNQLSSLDLTNNLQLSSLICSGNQITALDLSQNSSLTSLWCQSNQLIYLNVQNGNNVNVTSFLARTNPNLTCIQVDDPLYSTTNWTSIDHTASFGNNCAALLSSDPLHFKGQQIQQNIQLNWRSYESSNVAYYTIEKSLDGIHFEPLTQLTAQRTIADQQQKYTTLDQHPTIGINYYRLKAADLDGQYSYSPIIAIHFAINSPASIHLVPNPAHNNLIIKNFNPSEEEIFLNIYNHLGKLIFSNSFPPTKELNIDISNYPNASYILHVQQGQFSKNKIFVKA